MPTSKSSLTSTNIEFCSLRMVLPKAKNASTSEETNDTITASIGPKKKRRRISMERTVNRALRGKKSVVEFNPKGVPFGKVAAEMASYIGVVARTTVPIIVESWPKVEKDLKNDIWKSVEVSDFMFVIVYCSH